jgi:hypothetical protein
MTLHHEPRADNESAVVSARRTVAEASIVVAELRRFVRLCRLQPAAMDQVTAVDLAQARSLLAETRTRLARARQELF